MTHGDPRPPRRGPLPRLGVLLLIAASAIAAAVALRGPVTGAETTAAPGDETRAERGATDGGTGTSRGGDTRAGDRAPRDTRRERDPIEWRRSKAIGTHAAGRLARGVELPAEGREWVSWDPILKRRPNREWRRWGTDRLVRTTLNVLREFGRDHPRAPRVAVGDLSRPEGGDFGPRFGSIGHASHQNGLDVDVYYPRIDQRVRPPKRPGQVDLDLAQDLVDRFVGAGAEKVFVGPSLDLKGPADVVVPLVHHDNHLHARLPV